MTTKLEELKAAVDGAYANYAAACRDEAAFDVVLDNAYTTYAAADDEYVAYCEELEKQDAGTDKGSHASERLAPLDILNRMEEGK